MSDPRESEALAEPKNTFQQTLRTLAEAAMSVTHHDAADTEPGYIHEVQSMERHFARILKGKLKPIKPTAIRAMTLTKPGETM